MTFREKSRIALEEIGKARKYGLPHQATTAGCGYGYAHEFRAQLRAWGDRMCLR